MFGHSLRDRARTTLNCVCDTLVRITDHGVLFAKNSDRDPNEAQLLDWVPAAQHQPGQRVGCTWIDIDQVPSTRAVLLSRPWWMWGAEMGANDAGLVIGNEAVFTKGNKEPEPGLLGMDLLRLALERSGNRHEAVGVIVDLLERHGQGGSCSRIHPNFTYDNSFLIADSGGAVVLETAGRDHAVEEVEVSRSISNGLTIAGFADTHADRLRGRVAQERDRRAITGLCAADASTATDMMRGLRDHGGELRWSVLNGALRAPCAHAGGVLTATQTAGSWVSELGGTVRHWATGTAAPCTSVFCPVSVAAPVDLGPAPTGTYNPETWWWHHENAHRLAMHDPGATLPRLSRQRDILEESWVVGTTDSTEAFGAARALIDAWLSDIAAADFADHRPFWLRSMWKRWDTAAGRTAS